MASQIVTRADNLSSNTNRRRSGIIWGKMPIAEIMEDPSRGYYFFDDFTQVGGHSSTSGAAVIASVGQYDTYLYQGATLTGASAEGGVLTIGSDGDNEGVLFCSRTGAVLLASTAKKLCFEARIKVSSIADSKNNVFIGLQEANKVAAAVPIDTSDAIADQNVFGFWRLAGDGDKFDQVYKADGQTAVTNLADAGTLVADTFIKVGFLFDPNASTDKRITWYYDGVDVGTYVTSTLMSAAAFPSDVYMAPVLQIMNATGSTPGTVSIDWWGCCQEYA